MAASARPSVGISTTAIAATIRHTRWWPAVARARIVLPCGESIVRPRVAICRATDCPIPGEQSSVAKTAPEMMTFAWPSVGGPKTCPTSRENARRIAPEAAIVTRDNTVL